MGAKSVGGPAVEFQHGMCFPENAGLPRKALIRCLEHSECLVYVVDVISQ